MNNNSALLPQIYTYSVLYMYCYSTYIYSTYASVLAVSVLQSDRAEPL